MAGTHLSAGTRFAQLKLAAWQELGHGKELMGPDLLREPQQPMGLEHLPLPLPGGHAKAPFFSKSPEWIGCSTASPDCGNGFDWLG